MNSPATATTDVLTVSGLHAGYGQMRIVHEVDLVFKTHELTCIVGRNGAGKTTTLNAIAGVRPGVFSGRITLGDHDLSSLSPPSIVERGLSIVPEGHRVFKELSVIDNLKIGGWVLRRRRDRSFGENLARVFDLFPVLADFQQRKAGDLSGGQQQMVAIAQALISAPRFLLLDEPSSGLAPAIVQNIYDALLRLTAEGLGLVVVEQSVDRALRYSTRCYVIEAGRVALHGNTAELAKSDQLSRIVRGVHHVAEAPTRPPACFQLETQ